MHFSSRIAFVLTIAPFESIRAKRFVRSKMLVVLIIYHTSISPTMDAFIIQPQLLKLFSSQH